MDGLLVGISTITANDLVLNLLDRFGNHKISEKEKMKLALKASQVVLIIIAVLVFWVNLDPPELLGIFGQTGVYGLVLAAVPPLLAGVLFEKVPLGLVWLTSALAVFTHFLLYFFGKDLFPQANITFANPGVTATIGILTGLLPALVGSWWWNRQP